MDRNWGKIVRKNFFYIGFFILISIVANAQVKIDTVSKNKTFVDKSFFCNRIINAQSLENTPYGKLEFKFYHRMGTLDLGLSQFEQAHSMFGFEYGLSNRLMIGISRSTTQGLNNSFFKYKLIRQQTGDKNFPLSVLIYSSICINSQDWKDKSRENLFISRLSYTHQLIVGSKLTKNFSLVILPTLVHKNLVNTAEDKNDIFSLGAGFRYKLSRKIALNGEYFYIFPKQIYSKIANSEVKNSVSLGFEMNTGRHVFTVLVSNSIGTVEPSFITESYGNIDKNGLRFGFNMTRLFTLKR